MCRVLAISAALSLLMICGVPLASGEWLPILKVDVLDDTHTDASYVEEGFVGWAPMVGASTGQYPAPVSTTIGGITITFDSGAYHQDRYRTSTDLNGVPYEKMYRDSFWGRADDKSSQGLDITLAGLVPEQSYLVALYCFDYADWNGPQSCDWTANGQFAFNASWDGEQTGGHGVVPTAWDSFRRSAVVQADEGGKIVFVSAPGAGTAHTQYWANCSGIEVYAVPEPAMLVSLLTLAMVSLCRRRRA